MARHDQTNPNHQGSGDTHEQGDDEGSNRYQGGAGGIRSNAGPYAGTQTYGSDGDQLGYGSAPEPDGSPQPDGPDGQPPRDVDRKPTPGAMAGGRQDGSDG